MAKVSVVIPCFNQGSTIVETLLSVQAQSYPDFEIIIVNDGSTDEFTVKILNQINEPNTTVLHTSNKGLPSARNSGISASSGKYILPLDSDDLIEPTYIEKAVAILKNNESIGIVYCRANLFGAVNSEWALPPYTVQNMMFDNVIFCSALFRKRDWLKVGGYDVGMVYGWEDYDFWLSLIELGREVHQIPENLFFYRVASNSMVRSKDRWQKIAMKKRLFTRHQSFFSDNIEVWIDSLLDIREPYYTSKLYIDCGEGFSEKMCLSCKVNSGTAEVFFSLKDYANIKHLRFDPIDTPAVVSILEIKCIGVSGEVISPVTYKDNSLFTIDSTGYFDTDDPQCLFNVGHKHSISIDNIAVKMSIKALGSEALKQIVHIQTERLRQANQSILAKVHSLVKYRILGKT